MGGIRAAKRIYRPSISQTAFFSEVAWANLGNLPFNILVYISSIYNVLQPLP